MDGWMDRWMDAIDAIEWELRRNGNASMGKKGGQRLIELAFTWVMGLPVWEGGSGSVHFIFSKLLRVFCGDCNFCSMFGAILSVVHLVPFLLLSALWSVIRFSFFHFLIIASLKINVRRMSPVAGEYNETQLTMEMIWITNSSAGDKDAVCPCAVSFPLSARLSASETVSVWLNALLRWRWSMVWVEWYSQSSVKEKWIREMRGKLLVLAAGETCGGLSKLIY